MPPSPGSAAAWGGKHKQPPRSGWEAKAWEEARRAHQPLLGRPSKSPGWHRRRRARNKPGNAGLDGLPRNWRPQPPNLPSKQSLCRRELRRHFVPSANTRARGPDSLRPLRSRCKLPQKGIACTSARGCWHSQRRRSRDRTCNEYRNPASGCLRGTLDNPLHRMGSCLATRLCKSWPCTAWLPEAGTQSQPLRRLRDIARLGPRPRSW
mmetsp:Transcript_8561/g.20339  ORF Transcript_8561/g.20339 Transcript_8561/m.20339 type:complete len:208 (-) Transcript_8561:1342-1965(-)